MAETPDVLNQVIGPVTGPIVQAHTIHGGVHFHSPQRSVVPRQLPGAPRWFTGRGTEMTVLDKGAGTVMIFAIAGAGGIGKTALALHWAHRNADRFPDGQLYVDLRGFDPSGAPMTPVTAVRGFLYALGVDPADIPADVDVQAALYRSLTAGKRMLVVLDNTRDSAQMVPLLPGSPTCTVIVTSRNRLPGLIDRYGAEQLSLGILAEGDARAVLAARLGKDRLAAEPDTVERLLACCGGFPLALSIVAGRADAHPSFPLARLAAELNAAANRLGALDDDEPAANLSAVFSWSYEALPSPQAEMFRLLGLIAGPDISAAAAASLVSLPDAETSGLLRGLERASLVRQDVAGRYRMHDLIRAYAVERAEHDEPGDRREEASRRLVDFYLRTAHAADRLLEPQGDDVDLGLPVIGARPVTDLADMADARAWFDAEHVCLLAAQQMALDVGWDPLVWQLARVLDTFHARSGHPHSRLTAWRAAALAAQRSGTADMEARTRRRLGLACANVGRHDEAVEELRRALELAEGSGDLDGQAHAHESLARAWGSVGGDQMAWEHATHALRLFRETRDVMWEAEALNIVGRYAARLGLYDEARAPLLDALVLCRRYGNPAGEADTLTSLGRLAYDTRDDSQALDRYQQALGVTRNIGDVWQEADALDGLGQTYARLGRPDESRRSWLQALELYRSQHRRVDETRVEQRLAELDDSVAEPDPPSRSD
ncbi:ATP-binding protein [Streptomyces sp. NPDC057199]|uniref:ATP-binding protein n=1 Tax=Streptomyces sp. NPDC057199 TaxID=3346047 RepID=UPI003640974C